MAAPTKAFVGLLNVKTQSSNQLARLMRNTVMLQICHAPLISRIYDRVWILWILFAEEHELRSALFKGKIIIWIGLNF